MHSDADIIDMSPQMDVIGKAIGSLLGDLDGLNDFVNPFDVQDAARNLEAELVNALLWANDTRVAMRCVVKSDTCKFLGFRKSQGSNNRNWDNVRTVCRGSEFYFIRLYSFDSARNYNSYVMVADINDQSPAQKVDDEMIGLIEYSSVSFVGVIGGHELASDQLPLCCA